MSYKKHWQKSFLTLLLTWAILFGNIAAAAQDIPPTEELSLGSSVFIFRGSNKSAQKKYSANANSRVSRTKSQLIASRQKISRQYNALAKVTTRRERIKPITLPDVLQKSPKEAAAAFNGAGQYYFNQNDFDKSIEYFRQANSLDAANQDAKLGLSDALVGKGDKLMETEDVAAAQPFYEEAVAFNDKNSAAYAGLGAVFDELGENDKAIANYEKALALDKELTEVYAPLGVLYYEKGEIAKADDFLTKALAAGSDNEETQFVLGLIRYRQARYDDALAAFNKAIKTDADSPEEYFYLGEIYDKLNRENDALAAYRKAAQLNPKYVEAWFALGAENYNLRNYEEAMNAYREVTRLQNTNGAAHANLGDAYRRLNRFGEAEGEYRLAVVFIKDDAELYSKYGYVLGRQSKWSGAIDALNKALALSPDAIDYTNLGWAYYNAAQDDLRSRSEAEAKLKLREAAGALRKAVALNPNFAPAYLNLGVTLNDLGEYKEAIAALTRAVELRQNWVFAINELGIAYRKSNDFENAVKQFRKATELDNNFANGFYNLGEAEFRRGNVKETRKIADKLRSFNKNLANSLEVLLLGAPKK